MGGGYKRISTDTDKVTSKSLFVGGLIKFSDDRQAYASVTRNVSSDTDMLRNNFDGLIAAQMSEPGESTAHELQLSGTYYRKTDNLKGGQQFGLAHRSKFPLSTRAAMTFNIGGMLTSDTKLSNDITIQHDPSFFYGIDVSFHPDKLLSVELSLLLAEESGSMGDESNRIDYTEDRAVTSIGLYLNF